VKSNAQIVAESAFRHLFVDDDAILEAGLRCSFFEPHGKKAATRIIAQVRAALGDGSPFSLVRVGNGEGNAIGLTEEPESQAVFDGFDFEFVSQNGLSINPRAAASFSQLVVAAIKSADIQGYRIGRFDERALILDCLSKGKTSPALGIIYARWLFAKQLQSNQSQGIGFTNAWIHFDLMNRFTELTEHARSLAVISGRKELEGEFGKRFGSRLAWFAAVPVQGFVPNTIETSHFAMFDEVRRTIGQMDLRHTLVLVGAGLFGKVYCADVRQAGGVAIDMGSAFDLMAGLATRPAHRDMDLSAIGW